MHSNPVAFLFARKRRATFTGHGVIETPRPFCFAANHTVTHDMYEADTLCDRIAKEAMFLELTGKKHVDEEEVPEP